MQITTNKIKTLHLSFDLSIYHRQIQKWRGAFIEMAGWQDELFHNHNNKQTEGGEAPAKKYHYRYPRIQYRVKNGQASIFAINEGVDALQKVLASNDWNINWYEKNVALQIGDLRMNEQYFRMLAQPKRYKIFKWIALTKDSYHEWQNAKGMVQRSIILQKKLENHIVGMIKGLGWTWPQRIEVNLELLRKVQPVQVHGVTLLAFDVEFSCNVLLPSGLGIGKSVSHGFGWMVPAKVHQEGSISNKSYSKETVENKSSL